KKNSNLEKLPDTSKTRTSLKELGTELSIGCKRRTMLCQRSSLQKILRFPRAANEPLGLRPASLIEAFIPAGVYVFSSAGYTRRRMFKRVYVKMYGFTLIKILLSQHFHFKY